MPVTVLVPGYKGRVRAVEGWRMAVAVRTLAAHGGGGLVVSGHDGEAERLAALAPTGTEVMLDTAARSTRENVERAVPLLAGADRIAVAADAGQERRAWEHLRAIRPDLAERLVPAERRWTHGTWIQLGCVAYELLRAARRGAAAPS